jgi:hypothetical protein
MTASTELETIECAEGRRRGRWHGLGRVTHWANLA